MARILDISAPLAPELAVWPGDVPVARTVSQSLARGDASTVSALTTTLHAGTHADAPSHVLPEGAAMDAVDLAPYLGPCEVMAVATGPGALILPGHLPWEPRAPRLLLRTDSCPDPRRFTTDFNALSPDLVRHLHGLGCLLVGLDTPSVDPFDSEALESHRELARCGMASLEGLCLGAVSPGLYLLSALPLRIQGGDGSPVRAVLLES
jgi:arylformamidase